MTCVPWSMCRARAWRRSISAWATSRNAAAAPARFDAHLDEAGISLSLDRTGEPKERKSVRIHFHYALFAEILHELARTVSKLPPSDTGHRDALREGAKALYDALLEKSDASQMSPEEEVLLLHVME